MKKTLKNYVERAEDPWGLIEIGIDKNRKREIVKRIGKAGTILDIGCGLGFYSEALRSKKNRIISIDFSKRMVSDGKARFPDISFIQADANRLPIKADSIDAVLCMGTMIYIRNRLDFLRDVKRVLKRKGKLLLIERNRLSPLQRLIGTMRRSEKSVDNVEDFTTHAELVTLLRKSGFSITEISGDRVCLPLSIGMAEKALAKAFPSASYFLIVLAEKDA